MIHQLCLFRSHVRLDFKDCLLPRDCGLHAACFGFLVCHTTRSQNLGVLKQTHLIIHIIQHVLFSNTVNPFSGDPFGLNTETQAMKRLGASGTMRTNLRASRSPTTMSASTWTGHSFSYAGESCQVHSSLPTKFFNFGTLGLSFFKSSVKPRSKL